MQTPVYQREQETLRLLDERGRVTVHELQTLFGATAVTIRKDLARLEARRLIRRIRGGALPAVAPDEGAFEVRLGHLRAVKQAIALRAAEMVKDGDTVAIDCSTTCYYLAEYLAFRRDLVVVTNGLRAAEVLSTSATVILTGGMLRRASWSLVGDRSIALTRAGSITHGFFGVRSLSPEFGLLELSMEEAQAKRALATACVHRYALFDSSKVGRFALHTFVEPERVSGLFTDDAIDSGVEEAWTTIGVPVTRVSVDRGKRSLS